MHARQLPTTEHTLDFGDDALRCGEATFANISAGEPAFIGFHHMHTASAQHGKVVLYSRVFPHLGVHGRAHDDGGTGGDERVGEQIGRQPCGISSEEPSGGGHHQHQIGGLPEARMRNGVPGIPQGGAHRFATQCRQRGGTDEVLGPSGHDGHHVSTSINQPTAHLDGLVRGNTAGDTHHDTATSDHGCVVVRSDGLRPRRQLLRRRRLRPLRSTRPERSCPRRFPRSSC